MRTLIAAVAAVHTAFVAVVMTVITPLLVGVIIVARLLRVPDKPGGVYDKVPGWWSRIMLALSGVRLRVHGRENAGTVEPRIFVCNHLSWFDVFAMAAALDRGKYVAKSTLFRIPIFGQGMRAAGMIRIDRKNRKAAFASYEIAARRIRGGASVIVYPEGTRGRSYALRPFKKGPFVLAIAAAVPIVPVVMHGQMEVMRKGDWKIHPGAIDLHFLEPVPTAGYTYEQRDELMIVVWDRMARALRELYGVAEADSVATAPASAESPRFKAAG